MSNNSSSGLSLLEYYQGLLIVQYLGLPNANGLLGTTVGPVLCPQVSTETIVFSSAPSAGSFVLSYNGNNTASINWNDSASTIQTKLQALSGLSAVTVAGSIASQTLTVTFTGVAPPASLLVLGTNSTGVTITISATDTILPIALGNAFNLIGDSPAVGAQLDILGKYAGVVRSGYSLSGQPITLDDSDFLSLIQLATIKNSAGSSLATIQSLLQVFFAGEILVFDYANMQMSYLVSTSVGSFNLISLFITEGLLPKPMGVQVAVVIYAPVITTFFGFRTYSLPPFNSSPFNTYASYQLDYPFLSYADGIIT